VDTKPALVPKHRSDAGDEPRGLGYAERVTQPTWSELTARFEVECRSAGLDLLHPFAVPDYNAHVTAEQQLHHFGRARALGLLVGNTRALWPLFSEARAASPELRLSEHPLDGYVMASIARAAACLGDRAHISYFSHVTKPRALPIQRLAELTGFAALSPSHLAIHSLHGPWFALRAVVVVDIEGPSQRASAPPQPCQGCSAPCVAALDRARAASGPVLDGSSIARHAAEWIAVRDACPVGRASRYGEDQLRYHYGVDRQRPQGS
jgi:methylmalonic aciduria homocystinuria type C protein